MGQITKTDDQVANAMKPLRTWVSQNMPKIAAAVPEHVRPNQIVRTLFNALQANPDLAMKCTASSIGKCLIRAATYGLEINSGQLGHCYLVPYGNEAQLQLSYKGIKELVRRSGQGMIFMGEVREGDVFQDNGQDEKPTHQKSDDAKRHEKKLSHAYAYMKFTNGFVVSKVMSRNECISHRDRYSKSWARSKKADSPWHEKNDAFPKMCQKTCVHALANDGDIPLSADLREAMQTVEGSSFEGASVIEPQKIEHRDSITLPNESKGGEVPVAMSLADFEAAAKECDTVERCQAMSKQYVDSYPEQREQIIEIFDVRSDHIEIEEQERAEANG